MDSTKFMVCDIAAGIYMIDRSDAEQGIILIKGESTGCTDLAKAPLFHEDTFPYLIARAKFKIQLVDVKSLCIFCIREDMNTSLI